MVYTKHAFLLLALAGVLSIAMAAEDRESNIPRFNDLPNETEVVADFYRLLLQAQPPTLEQEQAIFDPRSGLRANLIEVQGANADEPLLLNLCRENRELFTPQNATEEQMLRLITISTPFTHSARALDSKKDIRTTEKNVIVTFYNLKDGKLDELRTLVFSVANGRIDADGILLDGFEATKETVLQTRFLKMPDGAWLVELPGRE